MLPKKGHALPQPVKQPYPVRAAQQAGVAYFEGAAGGVAGFEHFRQGGAEGGGQAGGEGDAVNQARRGIAGGVSSGPPDQRTRYSCSAS